FRLLRCKAHPDDAPNNSVLEASITVPACVVKGSVTGAACACTAAGVAAVHAAAYCFVQVPQPFDSNPLSVDLIVTIVGAFTRLLVIISLSVLPNPRKRA